MKIKNIGLAWVSTSNFNDAKKFFTETLGLTVDSGCDDYSWLELRGEEKGMLLGVAGVNDECEVKPGQNAVVTFTVDDIQASREELVQKGIKVGEIGEVPGHVKMCNVYYDGNVYQLVECLDACEK